MVRRGGFETRPYRRLLLLGVVPGFLIGPPHNLRQQPLRLPFQSRDVGYRFSANLPDRYLWMTLDSNVW